MFVVVPVLICSRISQSKIRTHIHDFETRLHDLGHVLTADPCGTAVKTKSQFEVRASTFGVEFIELVKERRFACTR